MEKTGQPMASREAYLVVNQPKAHPKPGSTKRRFLQVRGLDDPAMAALVHDIELLPGGQWFSQAGVRNLPVEQKVNGRSPSVIEVVLGQGAARELGQDRSREQLAAARNPQHLEVGDTFLLGERLWLVVGLMKSDNSTFNSELWAKRSLVGGLFGKDTYTTLVVRTRNPESAARFTNFLKHDYSKARVSADVETQYYASMSQTNKEFLFAISFVAVVMSVGGIFGVMNTMFAAISQRIKDIGVLRLLGFARWQILVSFLLESLVIALFGGFLGCAIGSLSDGWTATSVISGSSGAGRTVVLTLSVDRQTIAVGILVTLAMGLLGGLAPALSAMRLKLLDALR
jgi:ABC-type antimicrobial peptide transport system permease subunit